MRKRKEPGAEPEGGAAAAVPEPEPPPGPAPAPAPVAVVPAAPSFMTTHTRTCYLARDMFCGLGLDGVQLAGAELDARRAEIAGNLESEVRAVSLSLRNGSKFLELHIRALLIAGQGRMPANFPWSAAIRQAMFVSKTNPGTNSIRVRGFATINNMWQTFWPKAEHGLHLLAGNSVQAEVNGYERTLLKTYTRNAAIAAHTLWTTRYLLPAEGAVLKKLVTGRARPGTAAMPMETYDALPQTIRDLVQECHTIQDAPYDDSLISRAVEFRWAMLGLIDAKEREVKASGLPHQWIGRRGPVDAQAKRFMLVPQASKAARFITIDARVARRLLGLRERANPAKPEPAVYADPLRALFNSSLIQAWCRQKHVGRDGNEYPKTVKTDGVQLHIPFLMHHAGAPLAPAVVDARQSDPAELRRQLASPTPHGLFTIDAVVGAPDLATNVVGVDPGVRYLVATSDNFKLTRREYYGYKPRRTVFDRADAATRVLGNRDNGHSHRTRQNALPLPVHLLQQNLSMHAIRSAGQDHRIFSANLEIWLQSSEALQKYYGSRTHRACRLRRAAKGRRALQAVVNKVAPDPQTIVAFGASFYGRCCRTGDVAGPVAVKGIRRHLAKHRIVVATDEYNTTKMHLVCGHLLTPRPEDRHEMYCTHCGVNVDRDGNAARNIREVVVEHMQTGRRPAHLARPVSVPAPVFLEAGADVAV